MKKNTNTLPFFLVLISVCSLYINFFLCNAAVPTHPSALSAHKNNHSQKVHPATPPNINSNGAFQSNMSLEDFQSQWEKLSPAEQEAAAASLIDNLKPEERAVFDKIMDKFNGYTPEELEAIFNDEKATEALFNDILLDQDLPSLPSPTPSPPVSTTITPEEQPSTALPTPVVRPTPALTSLEQRFIATLSDLKERITEFTIKTTSIAQLPMKVPQWGAKKAIIPWQSEWTWANLVVDLEQFHADLSRSLKQDNKQKYLYISDILKNDDLVKKIECLTLSLNSCVKAIQISPLTIESVTAPLSRPAKISLQKTIGIIAEAVYICSLPKMLHDILDKKEGKEIASCPSETKSSHHQPINRISVAGKGIENEGYQPLSSTELAAYRKPYNPSYGYRVPSSPLPDVYKIKKPSLAESTPMPTSSTTKKSSSKDDKHDDAPHKDDKKKKESKKEELSADILISLNNIINAIHDAAEPLRIDTGALDPMVVDFSIRSATRKLAGRTNSALEGIKALQLKMRSATKEQKAHAYHEISDALASNKQFFDPYLKKAEKERAQLPSKKELSVIGELAHSLQEIQKTLDMWSLGK